MNDATINLASAGSTLTELTRYFARVEKPARPQGLANDFEQSFPDRHDFWLLRRTTYCPPLLTGPADAAEVMERIFSGLASPSLQNGTLTVLAWWNYDDFRKYFAQNTDAIQRLLNEVATVELDGTGREDRLINGILLPHVRLVLAELLEISPEIPHLTSIYKAAWSALDACLFPRKRRPDPLPYDAAHGWLKFHGGTSHLPWRLPWKTIETACRVPIVLGNLAAFVHTALADDAEVAARSDSELSALIGSGRDLMQCSWLTIRAVRKAFAARNSAFSKTIEGLRLREIGMAGELAVLEWLGMNYDKGAQYAAVALRQPALLPLAIRKMLVKIARERAVLPRHKDRPLRNLLPVLAAPDGPRPVTPQANGAERRMSRSAAWPRLLQTNAAVGAAMETIAAGGYTWVGLGEEALNDGAKDEDPSIRYAAFTGSFRAGRLLGAVKRLNKVDETIRSALRKEDVLDFAQAISNNAQHAAMFINHSSYRRLRVALRRLWKQISLHEFSVQELAYLHHALLGFTYHAILAYNAGTDAAHCIYNSAELREIEFVYEAFADQIRFRPEAFDLWRFQNSRLLIDGETVFISLATRHGHVLSLLFLAPNGCRALEYVSNSGKDWHVLIEEFHEQASDQIVDAYELDVHPWIEIGQDLIELVKIVADTALSLNPSARRIVLHCDLMWSALPWQFVLSVPLANWLSMRIARLACGAKHRRLKQQRPLHRAGLVAWVCQGIGDVALDQQSTTMLASDTPVPQHLVRHDESDELCQRIAAVVAKCRRGARNAQSGFHLSIVSHGRERSFAVALQCEGGAMSNRQLFEEYGVADLVAAHVCYGALALQESADSDTGGLPGFFLSHGARIVLATGLPVVMEQVKRIENYLANLATGEWRDVEEQYRSAIREHALCSLYTLHSNEVAPRLATRGRTE